VFASVDATGGAQGNWTLEYSTDPGVVFHPILLAGTSDAGGGSLGDPMYTWYAGTGEYTGYWVWDQENCSYYTKDFSHMWQHIFSPDEWKYFDTVMWSHTDALGDAQYDTGLYHAPLTWFTASSGTYAGYDVYIGDGLTYYSSEHGVSHYTCWRHSDSGYWAYFDASAWFSVTGFPAEPQNEWFHGFGEDAGMTFGTSLTARTTPKTIPICGSM
jgi:hypothetical protein